MVDQTDDLRIATWNIRWFPHGSPKDKRVDHVHPTDIEWLACTLAWMNVDLFTIQESLATHEAKAAWRTVTDQLRRDTGAEWRWYLQPCGNPDEHHIGFLWNSNRVTLSQFDVLWEFNVKARSPGEPCAGGLRPGLYARVQSARADGADFHLIGLHLKSGPTVFAVEDRHNALNRIDRAVAPLLKEDEDVVIVGDFNTMGAGDWHSRDAELKNVIRLVGKENPGFEDVSIAPSCTHYFRGRGGRLDHILIASGMEEAAHPVGQVSGYCAMENCRRIRGDYPSAYRHLSDHCPVIFQVQDRDRDP